MATKKSAKAVETKVRCPVFRESFDLVIRLSWLKKGEQLGIPTKRTARLIYWQKMERPGLSKDATLSETGIVLWVKGLDLKTTTKGVRIGVESLNHLKRGKLNLVSAGIKVYFRL